MVSWKVCTNYEYVSLINSKIVLELFAHLKLIKKISKPDCQKVEEHSEERYRSKDQITKLSSQSSEDRHKSTVKESQ